MIQLEYKNLTVTIGNTYFVYYKDYPMPPKSLTENKALHKCAERKARYQWTVAHQFASLKPLSQGDPAKVIVEGNLLS